MAFEPVTEPVLSKEHLGGASPSIHAGELHSLLINMLNLLEFPFSLTFLGQNSIQSAPEAAFSLESEGSEGACCSPLLCFLSFPPFYASLLPFPSMVKSPVSLPSFSHFAKDSSPFLQRAVCSFTESSKKLEEQEEGALLQVVDTSFFFFFFSSLLFPPYISSLVLSPFLNFVCFCRC